MGPIKAILFEPSCLADAEGPFEDVAPAFDQLRAMDIQIEVAADSSETMYVTDNAAGLDKARAAGMIPILLMNDPDEAMRLVTTNKPEGAIVSLAELPDFLRLLSTRTPCTAGDLVAGASTQATPAEGCTTLSTPDHPPDP